MCGRPILHTTIIYRLFFIVKLPILLCSLQCVGRRPYQDKKGRIKLAQNCAVWLTQKLRIEYVMTPPNYHGKATSGAKRVKTHFQAHFNARASRYQ